MSGEPFRILIADAISEAGLAPLRERGRFEIIEQSGLKGEALARAIAGCDAVIVRSSTQITSESLAYADRLKVIGRAGVGVDNIDVSAATARGIAVLNARSGNTISAAELAFALLLALVRRIPAADRSMRAGEWDRRSFSGVELHGKTLGLLGVGRIGGEVARRARTFGMRVLAHDPFVTPDRATALQVELVELDRLIREVDVLSLHVPLTDATAGMLGRDEIVAMKRGVYVINAARGGVLDEAALLEALESGHVAGAALDVFAEEPLPAGHALRAAANVVLTPHLGAATAEAQQNVALEIARAVRGALVDGDYSSAVNAPAVGGEELQRLRPLIDLSTRLGRLVQALTDAPMDAIEVHYAGRFDEGVRMIAVGALTGVLESVVGRGAVNFVNALYLAEARGIHVERSRRAPRGDYAEFIELRTRTGSEWHSVAGALLAAGHPRIVRIGEYRVSVRSRGGLIVLRNRDVPGVIGAVGTVLGRSGVNIGEYHQSRLQQGGEALAAISFDGDAPDAAIAALAALPEVLFVKLARLD
jgi:D-3-phosphoglycerate dehydrogenase / 2-oxoglutarate reductase